MTAHELAAARMECAYDAEEIDLDLLTAESLRDCCESLRVELENRNISENELTQTCRNALAEARMWEQCADRRQREIEKLVPERDQAIEQRDEAIDRLVEAEAKIQALEAALMNHVARIEQREAALDAAGVTR